MKVSRTDWALLALRLVLGAAFVTHGWPKIHHPTTWAAHALPGAPPVLVAIAAYVEFGGGLAMLAGIGTRIAGFLIAANMVVAIFFALVPRGATYISETGATSFELPLAYLTVAFALLLLGAGELSADGLRSRRSGGRHKIGSRTGGRRSR